MKKLKVLYFGSLSEAAGKQEEIVEFDGGLEALKNKITDSNPGIKELRFSVAVNQEITAGDRELNDGDEIALLPPFTGG